MTQASYIEEIDPATGQVLRRLWRARQFALAYPQIAGSYDTIRRRIHQRHENGLLACGAVIDTALGLRVEPTRYQEWLLRPRIRRDQSEAA